MEIEVRRVDKYKEVVLKGYNSDRDLDFETGLLNREEAVELSKEFIQAALELLE